MSKITFLLSSLLCVVHCLRAHSSHSVKKYAGGNPSEVFVKLLLESRAPAGFTPSSLAVRPAGLASVTCTRCVDRDLPFLGRMQRKLLKSPACLAKRCAPVRRCSPEMCASGADAFTSATEEFERYLDMAERDGITDSDAMVLEEPTEEALELKEELLDLLEEVKDCDRGIEAPEDLADDIVEVVAELDAQDVAGAWSISPDLEGTWRLVFSSSTVFKNNKGLTGIAAEFGGFNTPDLVMKVKPAIGQILFDEKLVETGEVSFWSVVNKALIGSTGVSVDCSYKYNFDNSMTLTTHRMSSGDQEWKPADKQRRAIRSMGNVRPVYLDDDLLVMRAQVDYVVWVYEKVD